MDQILNSIRQVKQTFNNLDSRLNEISQLFNQSFQELNNCEQVAQSMNQHQFTSAAPNNYGTSNYGGNRNYQSGSTMQQTAGQTGLTANQNNRQFATNQTRGGVQSQYNRDQQVGSSYYNNLANTGYNTQGTAGSGTGAGLTSGYNRNTGYNQQTQSTYTPWSNKQNRPSQTPKTTSMNTRDNDIGSGYYNMKSASSAGNQFTGMNQT